jgi:hypothetical protein
MRAVDASGPMIAWTERLLQLTPVHVCTQRGSPSARCLGHRNARQGLARARIADHVLQARQITLVSVSNILKAAEVWKIR